MKTKQQGKIRPLCRPKLPVDGDFSIVWRASVL